MMDFEKFLKWLQKLGTLIMFLGIAGIVVNVLLSFLNQTPSPVIIWGLLAVVGYILRTQLPKPSSV